MSEVDVSALLTVAQAITIIDAVQVHPRIVRRSLPDAAGLRLAADIAADRDYPPFDKSLMDGYAVRSQDLATVPATLTVIGEVPAGRQWPGPLEAGQALAIMTGAPIPPGA